MIKTVLRIFNIEDDARDAELNQAVLSERWPGCEFVRVANRRDYLAALEQGHFDVILCDYTMPGFDGRVALELARTDGLSVAVEVRSTPLIFYGRALVLRLCHKLNGPHHNHIP